MTDAFGLRRGIPTRDDMEKINEVSLQPLNADQVYIFGMRLCDNEIDRDFERFTTHTLEQLVPMYIGKLGIVKDLQVGRIYDAELITDPDKTTRAGDPYCWIKAYAYVIKNDDTQKLISHIRSGTQAEVSIGCSVTACTCSICGEDIATCSHKLSQEYDGRLCFANLNGAYDAYDWAFVVEPHERKTTPAHLAKTIDPIDVKRAVMAGLLDVKVNNGNILLGNKNSGEWVKIGEI
ncbi:MAG: hypothetical protein NC548_61460 [Lachnospiraceae bacterium]|nr:hypothetical protein [Lachnospiraceae bacterium]